MALKNTISSDLSDEEKAEVTQDFRLTLGTIAILFAPSLVIDLAYILSVKSREIKQTLADLHSILDLPSDIECPIRLYHPSFRDFLYDRSRCRNESFYVDKVTTHSLLANRSFNAMFILRKDICYLKSPSIMVEDIEPRWRP